MTTQNTAIQKPAQNAQVTVKNLFNRDDVKKKFEELLGRKAPGFITSVLQAVSQNSLLAQSEPNSVYQSAATAAMLDLPINQNLGFAYIIPYSKKGSVPVAQFQMGYKGFIQLAQRSGLFKTISATPIYQGQLTHQNPLTGFEFDFSKKESNDIIGYAAYFSLLNGFEKTLYMTVEEVKNHGGKYSQTMKKGFGLWTTDFDAMATKTVIKLLLSKYAPLSIEMQRAVVADQAIINNAEGEDYEYADSTDVTADSIDKETERVALMIEDCLTVDELKSISPNVPEILTDLYNERLKVLEGK